MPTKPLVFLDLDDTIFQTARKMETLDSAIPASVNTAGETNSWMNPVQSAFFLWLSQSAEVIPVTGRSVDQLNRVLLPFNSWKIACHGALIMSPAGMIEPHWEKRIRILTHPLQRDLRTIYEACVRFYADRGFAARGHIESIEDLGIYIVMKHADWRRLQELYAVREVLAEIPAMKHFYITANDNNFSILPGGLDKGMAARHLLKSLACQNRPVLGFGDGLADLAFMNLCDWWGTPRASQITRSLGQSLK